MKAVLKLDDGMSEDVIKNTTVKRRQESFNISFSFFLYRLIAYADERRSIASFVFVLLGVISADFIFNKYLF